jgi:osmotically-inducible protein OsmY
MDNQGITDHSIRVDIRAHLEWDDRIDTDNIKVSIEAGVENGIVGKVSTFFDRCILYRTGNIRT